MNEDEFDHQGMILFNFLYVENLKMTLEWIHFLYEVRNNQPRFFFNVEYSKS